MRAEDITACRQRLCLFSLKGRQPLIHFKWERTFFARVLTPFDLPTPNETGWRAPIYSLAPHCLSGGEGHAVARGDCRRHAGSRQPTALSFHSVSRKQKTDSRQPLADNGPPRPPPSPSFRAKRSGAEKSPTAMPLP